MRTSSSQTAAADRRGGWTTSGRPTPPTKASFLAWRHRVAQVRHADARGHSRVGQGGRRRRRDDRRAAKPEPRSTATTSAWSSSSRPAFRHCWMMSAPWAATSFSPARPPSPVSTALSRPSVTKCPSSSATATRRGSRRSARRPVPTRASSPALCNLEGPPTVQDARRAPAHRHAQVRRRSARDTVRGHRIRTAGVEHDVAGEKVPTGRLGQPAVHVGRRSRPTTST